MMHDYAGEYERSFGFFKDYSREAAFLDRLFKLHHGGISRVLDIACGPGSHIVELARMGYQCAATDIDPEMLEMTQRRAAKHGIRVETFPGDIRRFRIAERFDAALNMFYSFQNVLFTHQEQTDFFQAVAAILPHSGVFVIEIMPEENNLRLYPPGSRTLVHESREENGDVLVVTSSSRIRDEEVKEIVFSYETTHPDGEVEVEEFVSPFRRVRRKDFENLVEIAGFRMVGAYAGCDMDAPFTEDSAKLLAVLQKS